MPLRYYPLTRIIPNQYTNGNEFVQADGTPYTGNYYITYDNKVFTGANPVIGTNKQLFPAPQAKSSLLARGIITAAPGPARVQVMTVVNGIMQAAQSSGVLSELAPYYPIALDEDYARGYFTRYFAKNVTGPGYVVEISQTDWSSIQSGKVASNVLAYETIDMLWQLTGPLHDKRVSQYQIIGGVYDTNKRVTEAKAKGFVGLLNFIDGDYTKFAKITP